MLRCVFSEEPGVTGWRFADRDAAGMKTSVFPMGGAPMFSNDTTCQF